MIICRAPYRLSLFGGGSDFPGWFREHDGAVLSTTINKYCYLTVRYLPPYFEHKHRVVWSHIENVATVDEIQHPIVRECLKYLEINEGLEIHHDGDIPARSGLGTSSSFAVGLLQALHTLKGDKVENKLDLALEAIHIERDLCKDAGGWQDQIASSVGGLNFIKFGKDKPEIQSLGISSDRAKELESCLMMVFTGFPHTSSAIASTYNFSKEYELTEMTRQAYEALDILKSGKITQIGELLHEAWQFKKSLSPQISSPYLDWVYQSARDAGAIGGKISGSGGGGFMTLFAEPDAQPKIKEKLGSLLQVPVKFEEQGVQVIFNNGGDA